MKTTPVYWSIERQRKQYAKGDSGKMISLEVEKLNLHLKEKRDEYDQETNFGKNIPERKDFPSLTNETYTASRIHGETGWIIYSIETKEVKAEETTNIEERIIEIK